MPETSMARSAARRPLKTRRRRWAIDLARWFTARGVPPNAISISSIVLAAIAAAALIALPGVPRLTQAVLLLLTAALIQLRLLANMLDGMVAVEGGRKSPTGDLFNEVPDRIADILFLVAAGYAVGGLLGPILGWTAALFAVLTAYVRVLGGSLGLPQDFRGPMAKPHRMATLTAACLLSIVETLVWPSHGRVLAAALVIIALGSLVTAARRLRSIAEALRSR
jgi:phosphatidylglycerophosphate synthase